MFFYGIHEVKKRVIEYLQDTLGHRPLFENVAIFNHHPNDQERAKINVVVTGSSSEQIQLSPDNFVQTDLGYASQAKVTDAQGEHPGYFLAWVADDYSTLDASTHRVDPAVYYLTMTEVSGNQATLQIDVLGVIKREVVLFNYTGETVLQLAHYPVVEGTFQLFVDRGLYPPSPPADFYDIDLTTGRVTLNRIPAVGSKITASYNWVAGSLPDVQVEKGIGRNDILTGINIGFSEEFVEGDRAAIVVSKEKEPSALTFGGRMGVSLQIDTRSQDTPQAEKVTDALMETLWGLAKGDLKHEGLDITNVGVGGEAVEPEDETGQEWAFQFSATATVEAEWQTRVPLLRRYSYGIVNLPADVDYFSATDEELVEASLKIVDDLYIGVVWVPGG